MKIVSVSPVQSEPVWHMVLVEMFGSGHSVVFTKPSSAAEEAQHADIVVVDIHNKETCRATVLDIRAVRPECPIVVQHPDLLNISAVSWRKSFDHVHLTVQSLLETLHVTSS